MTRRKRNVMEWQSWTAAEEVAMEDHGRWIFVLLHATPGKTMSKEGYII